MRSTSAVLTLKPNDIFVIPTNTLNASCMNVDKHIDSKNTYRGVHYQATVDINEAILIDKYCKQAEMAALVDETEGRSMYAGDVEIGVRECGLAMRTELHTLFPDRNLCSPSAVLTVLSLNHRTKAAMSVWDASVATEREQLAAQFVNTARELCRLLTLCGFWADFIDPYSGRPSLGPPTRDALMETDPRVPRLTDLAVVEMGCCKLLSHPSWGPHVFSGLLFTSAPCDHPLLSP